MSRPVLAFAIVLAVLLSLPAASADTFLRAKFRCGYDAFAGLYCEDVSETYTERPIVSRAWTVDGADRGTGRTLRVAVQDLPRSVASPGWWLTADLPTISLTVSDGIASSVCSTDGGRGCYGVPPEDNTPRAVFAVGLVALVIIAVPLRRKRAEAA